MNYRELPKITKKQEEIIDLIYRFRFINRKQLQRYLKHKDARRINAWLKDLVEKKYLGRIYSHKLLENTKPAIYYLNNNGIIWVRYEKGMEYGATNEQLEMKYLKKFYEDMHASDTFINHCTTLFQLYIQLKEKEATDKESFEYAVETKTELWITKQLDRYEDFDEIKQYLPDLYIEKLTNLYNENIASSTFFVELFDPHMPRYAIKYRIKQYIKFIEDGKWEDYSGLDGKFPRIMLIFPNQQKINFLSKYIREQLGRSYESDGLLFLVTTHKKVITEGITSLKIWQEIKE